MEKDMIICPTCRRISMVRKKPKLLLVIVNKINKVARNNDYRITNFCKCPDCGRWIFHTEVNRIRYYK